MFHKSDTISHIPEEDENSQLEMSYIDKSEADGETNSKNKNLIKPTSQDNSKLIISNSFVLSKSSRSHKSSSDSSSMDCDIKFINKNSYNNNIMNNDPTHEKELNILLNTEKETDSKLNYNENYNNSNLIIINNSSNFNIDNNSNDIQDAESLINKKSNLIKYNIKNEKQQQSTNYTRNDSSFTMNTNNDELKLKNRKTFVKGLIDKPIFKTLSSRNINNFLISKNFSNSSKKSKNDSFIENSSGPLVDLIAIPKITVRKKIDEKHELKAEILQLRSNNEDFNNRGRYKESSKLRKVTATLFNNDPNRNINYFCSNNIEILQNKDNNNRMRSPIKEQESYFNGSPSANDESVENIIRDEDLHVKKFEILDFLKKTKGN